MTNQPAPGLTNGLHADTGGRAYRHRGGRGKPKSLSCLSLQELRVCDEKRDTDYIPPVDGYHIVRPSILPVAKRDSLFVGRPVSSSS